MCLEFGLKCEVHSTAKLHELGMGAFWAVSQGSPEPPALIVMTYEPKGGAKPGAPVLGLVGKDARGLFADEFIVVGVEDRLIEGHPTKGRTRLDVQRPQPVHRDRRQAHR